MIRPNSMAYSPLILDERIAPGPFVAASCQKPGSAATHKPAFGVRFRPKSARNKGRRVETPQVRRSVGRDRPLAFLGATAPDRGPDAQRGDLQFSLWSEHVIANAD